MLRLGLTCIWLMSLPDYVLTHRLILTTDRRAEANLIARWLVTHAGAASLLPFKVALLSLFTWMVLLVARRNIRAAGNTVKFGVVVHALLAAWWTVVLTAHA